MKPTRNAPETCRTLEEVRFGVDRLDEEILALVARRLRCMDAAARIKPVRDEARKAQVLANAARLARAREIREAATAAFYEILIEASIAYELDRFDSLRAA
jgi:isochorismate pyruvate lyase